MEIKKEQWQKWAHEFAAQEAADFQAHVNLTLGQAIILKSKLEAAALYGMDLAAAMQSKGGDLSQVKHAKPTLFRGGTAAQETDNLKNN